MVPRTYRVCPSETYTPARKGFSHNAFASAMFASRSWPEEKQAPLTRSGLCSRANALSAWLRRAFSITNS